MKNLLSVATVSALVIGAGIPASAATFADLSGLKVGWTRSLTGGTFNVTGNDYIEFAVGSLPTTAIEGKLVITATETATDAVASNVAPGVDVYVQQGISGTFNEIYEGSGPLTINGVTLYDGDTILSGTITRGTLSATKLTGPPVLNEEGQLSFQATDFSSPLIDFGSGSDESVGFTIALATSNWGVTTQSSLTTLNSFSGTATGQFLAASVMEPACWMLMLGGVGFTGAALRRRREVGVPA